MGGEKNYDSIEKYDEDLKKIKIYKIHPELLPYIGENYDDRKILLIGESHYIPFADKNQYEAADWYNKPVPADQNNPFRKYLAWYKTREVLERYMDHDRGRGHQIYSSPAKIMLADDDRKGFSYYAFMNYYQRPALEEGNTIRADKKDDPVAKDTLMEVIKVLKPLKVAFLSKKARNAFLNVPEAVDLLNSRNIKYDSFSHPNCPWWNRRTKDGSTAREKFRIFIEQ